MLVEEVAVAEMETEGALFFFISHLCSVLAYKTQEALKFQFISFQSSSNPEKAKLFTQDKTRSEAWVVLCKNLSTLAKGFSRLRRRL